MAERKDYGPEAEMADIMREASNRQYYLVTPEEQAELRAEEIRALHVARLTTKRQQTPQEVRVVGPIAVNFAVDLLRRLFGGRSGPKDEKKPTTIKGRITWTAQNYRPRGEDEPATEYAEIVRCVALAAGQSYSAGAIRVELQNQRKRDGV
jgi:hypothetical protein